MTGLADIVDELLLAAGPRREAVLQCLTAHGIGNDAPEPAPAPAPAPAKQKSKKKH